MKKTACLFLLFLSCMNAACAWADAQNIKKPMIAILMSYAGSERWEKDLAAMRDYAQARDIELLVEVTYNNQMQQNTQAARVLAQHPDVLILTPHDAVSSAFIVATAKAQGTKVIAYDRLVLNAGVDLYVSFDNIETGRLLASYLVDQAPSGNYVILSGAPSDYSSKLIMDGVREVLEPKIAAGRIKVVAEGPVIGWDPPEVREIMLPVLEAGTKITAVLASNDTSAGEAVSLLAAFSQAGQTLVVGQDGLMVAARRIAMGTQSATAFKDSRQLGSLAMDLAIKMAAGHNVSGRADQMIFDGSQNIPAILLPTVLVDRTSLKEKLIDPGFMTREQIYGRQIRDLPSYGH